MQSWSGGQPGRQSSGGSAGRDVPEGDSRSCAGDWLLAGNGAGALSLDAPKDAPPMCVVSV